MKIKIADQSDKQRWDEYVLNHPDGIAYQLFAWKETVRNAYGFESHYIMALQDKKIVGVLPLTIFQIPFVNKSYVSLPYCDAGGPLADSPEIEKELLLCAVNLADENQIKKLVIRSTSSFAGIDDELTENPGKVRMVLELPDNSEVLIKSFKSKLRSQVKKPGKDGLSIEFGSIDILDEFYRLFAENMRDLGSPVHSAKWFESILTTFNRRAVLLLVRMPDQTPAAGGIILCHKKVVSVPWASSLRRFNRSNPNMLLYWGFLKYASDNGFKKFDFGRSTPNEGTFRFKKQWGAVPKPLHWSDFSISDRIDNLKPDIKEGEMGPSNLRKIVEKMISKMPVQCSTIIGSMTRKYISL